MYCIIESLYRKSCTVLNLYLHLQTKLYNPMKRQIVAVILSMSYLLVFAQTSNDTSHLYRIGDIIYSNSIGNIYR